MPHMPNPYGRSAHLVVHHTGSANAHSDYTTDYCTSGYDAFIRYNGQLIVCNGWNDNWGGSQSGCQCNTMGVMLNGCFGGCTSGNVSRPSAAQECTLASIAHHFGIPFDRYVVVPHRHCHHWAPCGPGASTVCCGANLTSSDPTCCGPQNWSSAGLAFRSRVMTKWSNIRARGCCNSTCPV